MAELHFRVFTSTFSIPEFMEWLKCETDVVLAVREIGKSNREHIHATLRLKTAKSTFLDHLKKKFPSIIGNKSYSLKPVRDADKNYRYCYKGKPAEYPDILHTMHAEDEWKLYYDRYWAENAILSKPTVNMGCQNDPVGEVEVINIKKVRVRTRTFMEKLADELWEEHRPLFSSIWYFYGYTDGTLTNNLDYNQEYLANFLYKKLGSAVKNIDNFIFERLYTGLYAHILQRCPQDITHSASKSLLDTFKHKLPLPTGYIPSQYR